MVKHKQKDLTVTNIEISLHRNGICGAPFHVTLFDHEGSRKVAILFENAYHCAVLDVEKLAENDIAFGSNSFRGDFYETALRNLVRLWEEERDRLYNSEQLSGDKA